jgi:hypothetical protein
MRDPVVIDPELDALQFRRKDGRVLGTVVRWSCHPEALWEQNKKVSADYPGFLCAEVERKTGGECAFFSGTIGGLLSPVRFGGADPEGQYQDARRIGEAVASQALAALEKGDPVDGRVGFASKIVRLPVENSLYTLFLPSLAFGHTIYDADGKALSRWGAARLSLRHLLRFPLPAALRPRIDTEVSRVDIGPVRVLGIPGELFSELAIGGYDGSRRYGHPLVGPDNANPPVLWKAPKGPYLREELKAKRGMIVGLANDEIGYIVPPYDFQVRPNRLMIPHPPGTHYEETNSIGPSAAPAVVGAAEDLLKSPISAR